ncbi:hypothetical protein B0T18DRAFT_65618 [Schizothecium vesticola]|uniref:Ubiquitin-like protease family profile domain-containing protein n=1 Tax=Schizothecium vesticola TaxID=314040 RepID=A0AA40F4P7_9PEZI|nr:hypothetical protein B0T18DRAFT_65618 [Schizothecium vesticola]
MADSNPDAGTCDPVLSNKTVKDFNDKSMRRARLQSELGLLADMSTYEVALLDPGEWIDQTTLNGCIRMFTRNNPSIFCFSTWTPQEQEARSGSTLPKDDIERFNEMMELFPDGVLKAIVWPFYFTNHFVLCVLRPDRTATVYDSLGNGECYLGDIQERLPAQFQEWRMEVGASPLQTNRSDCGIYCIVIAAFLASGRDVPSSINASF